MMPSVPSEPIEQPRQVVAGRALLGALAGRDQRCRRPSPPSATARCRASCRSARRWCRKRASPPCRRGWRWRPGRSGRTGRCRADASLSCLARHAGLDDAVEILGIDLDDAVHARDVERDAAARRVDVPFERRAGAEGDHRHAMLGADAHDLLHLLGRFRERRRRPAPASGYRSSYGRAARGWTGRSGSARRSAA